MYIYLYSVWSLFGACAHTCVHVYVLKYSNGACVYTYMCVCALTILELTAYLNSLSPSAPFPLETCVYRWVSFHPLGIWPLIHLLPFMTQTPLAVVYTCMCIHIMHFLLMLSHLRVAQVCIDKSYIIILSIIQEPQLLMIFIDDVTLHHQLYQLHVHVQYIHDMYMYMWSSSVHVRSKYA